MSEKTTTAMAKHKAKAQYAGLMLRSIAMAVDLSIVLGILALAELTVQLTGFMIPTGTHLTVLAVFAAVVSIAYFSLFDGSSWRSTPGKRWLGLRVTDLHGKRISRGRALARASANLLGAFTLGLHSFAAAKHKKVQTFPDRLTGVVVLQKPTNTQSIGTLPERMIPVGACIGMAAILVVGMQTKQTQSKVPTLYEPPFGRMSVDLMERASPLKEFVLASLIATGKVPTEVPAEISQKLPNGKLGDVTFDRRSGNIIISMQTSQRKGTIALTPVARGQGQWRWACGLAGIEPSEVPASCRRD